MNKNPKRIEPNIAKSGFQTVNITRAKLNLIVNERKEVSLFDSFFNQNFKKFKPKNAVELLSDILEKDNLKQYNHL